MSINLSQLKTDKVRVTIPLYINDGFIDNIEIYNPTNEQAIEIEKSIENNNINDELRYKLFKDLTNINIDIDMDEFMVGYYSDLFIRTMLEIDNIIFEVASNYMVKMSPLVNMPVDKKEIFNNLLITTNKLIEDNEVELKQIENKKQKKKQEKELNRQIDEAKIKLEQLKGD
jgi:hypothetical protein